MYLLTFENKNKIDQIIFMKIQHHKFLILIVVMHIFIDIYIYT